MSIKRSLRYWQMRMWNGLSFQLVLLTLVAFGRPISSHSNNIWWRSLVIRTMNSSSQSLLWSKRAWIFDLWAYSVPAKKSCPPWHPDTFWLVPLSLLQLNHLTKSTSKFFQPYHDEIWWWRARKEGRKNYKNWVKFVMNVSFKSQSKINYPLTVEIIRLRVKYEKAVFCNRELYRPSRGRVMHCDRKKAFPYTQKKVLV